MNRAIGKVALLLAVVALSGCGDATSSDEQPTVETTEAETSDAAETSDTAETSEAEEASDGEPMENPPPAQYPLDNVTGQDEYGTVYSMSPLQPFPEEAIEAINGAGIVFESVTPDDMRMACVEVDNTQGNQEASFDNLIVVTVDGAQHEFRTMGDYLFELSEGVDYNANYDAYTVLFDLSQEESGKENVAPTATSNVCLPFDPALEGEEFTYIAVTGGVTDVPLSPAE